MLSSSSQAAETTQQTMTPWWVILIAPLAWLGLWYLTPGLLSNGVGSLFSDEDAIAVLFESILALVVVTLLLLLHRRYNRTLFEKSHIIWVYMLPLISGAFLPLYYSQLFPIALYMFWMTVSVFWQNYLTFGLLQSYLLERLRPWVALVISAVMFWLGHALLLPQSFAPTNPLPSLAILALGFVLGGLRLWLGSLHLILALHLTFYFIFA